MKKTGMIFVGLFALAACDVPPIVSDYNGDSVTIVTSSFQSRETSLPAAQAEATRICQTGGKTRAEYASTRANPNTYEYFNLFLCL
ncbi:hypothetical protein [Actibacterium lipolyticum]|uniref:Lipoprotein n=1 Tax=Actibacterium lipolyticum TaxID=1524263 RepID=A0A238JWT3_9RHOB|nr:hypothetical protein [Actibacterium lipolyticum]SMX34624.1 hypothetical protein COL8621_01403 [Actibacterium lipolyticum]